MSNKLKIKCKGSGVCKIDELLEYQGNLKDLTESNYDMLRQSIEEGFINPINIWIKPDNTKHIMDGHQRLRVLKKMREEGWEIPEVPICEVYADTEQEAANIVLKNISQYGSITAEGLIEFTQTYKIEMEYVQQQYRFPEINLKALCLNIEKTNAEEEWKDMPEFNQEDKTSIQDIIIHFNTREDIDNFSKLINQNITEKTKSLWFPKQENMETSEKKYV